MAVIKITDSKVNLPPLVQVSIGRNSKIYKVNSLSLIYNKPVI